MDVKTEVQEHIFDQPGSLMKEVQALIKKDTRSLPEKAAATGISYYWLVRFLAGTYRNPSVNRVAFLYTFFSGKELV